MILKFILLLDFFSYNKLRLKFLFILTIKFVIIILIKATLLQILEQIFILILFISICRREVEFYISVVDFLFILIFFIRFTQFYFFYFFQFLAISFLLFHKSKFMIFQLIEINSIVFVNLFWVECRKVSI